MSKKLSDSTATRKALLLYALLLFTGKRYFLGELAQKCQCTKPTVLRLMREIENAGVAAIKTGIDRRKRYFQIVTPPGTPRFTLHEDAVERLALCRDLIEHILPDGMERMITDALSRISILMENVENRAQATAIKGSGMVKGHIDYTPFQGFIDTILKAIRDHTVCAIRYAAPNKEPRVFEVVPVRLTADAEALYTEGWRVASKGTPVIRFPTTLAIHRMRECVLTRRALKECPELPEPEGAFGLIGDVPFPVRAAFDVQHAPHIKERLWSKVQRMVDLPGGGVELSFTATSKEQVVSWILGFGSGAELLEPEELRNLLRDEARNMAHMYNESETETDEESGAL